MTIHRSQTSQKTSTHGAGYLWAYCTNTHRIQNKPRIQLIYTHTSYQLTHTQVHWWMIVGDHKTSNTQTKLVGMLDLCLSTPNPQGQLWAVRWFHCSGQSWPGCLPLTQSLHKLFQSITSALKWLFVTSQSEKLGPTKKVSKSRISHIFSCRSCVRGASRKFLLHEPKDTESQRTFLAHALGEQLSLQRMELHIGTLDEVLIIHPVHTQAQAVR